MCRHWADAAPQTIADTLAAAAQDPDAARARGTALQSLVETEHTWAQTARLLDAAFA